MAFSHKPCFSAYSIPSYWRNTAFIAPEETNLGRLEANSTLSFPVELKQIIRYNIPADRFEMRDDKDPNTVIFLPDVNDTARWENGPDYIVVDSQDVTEQWYYKFKPEGSIEFSYCYKNRTRYDYVYNGTFDNGTEVPVNVIETVDVNLTTSRKLLSSIPPPIERLYESSSSGLTTTTNVDGDGRKLVSVENPGDCLVAALCTVCEMLWSEQKKKKKKKKGEGGPKQHSQEERELGILAGARAAAAAANKICDTIKKYTEKKNKYQLSVGIPIPEPIKKACDALNPCKWVCPEQTNLRGTTFVSCFELDSSSFPQRTLKPCFAHLFP